MATELAKLEAQQVVEFKLDDEVLSQIVELADGTLWVKVTQLGFVWGDKVAAELVGVIADIRLHCIRWEGQIPTKIPFTNTPPEGFKARVDLKIMVSGQMVGLSLPPSTVSKQLAPFLTYLKNQNFRPDQVITRLQTRQASNAYGSFTVVVFECLGPINGQTAASAVEKSPAANTPPSVQNGQVVDAHFKAADSGNPWA